MASGPITSWQINGEMEETVADFIWGAPKSLWTGTAAMKLKDVCSLGEKKPLQNSILKSRDSTLLTKAHIVKDMVFPIVI